MQPVLLDTSVLLDLVLFFQARHRRNRCIASSSACAVEALLFYEHIVVESPSIEGILASTASSRFLKFYCDSESGKAKEQLRQLASLCHVMNLNANDTSKAYDSALHSIDSLLDVIESPDELRAYEMYDYLPYHLGEDPTAVECQVLDPSAVDIDAIQTVDESCRAALLRLTGILKRNNHPTRAAWALPLLRLFYYESLQMFHHCHFIPHATKSTLAFGRESETVAYRRLLGYCKETFRSAYWQVATQRLSGRMILVPVPSIAAEVLRTSANWETLVVDLNSLRSNSSSVKYRLLLQQFLTALTEAMSFLGARGAIESIYSDLEFAAGQCAKEWNISGPLRYIRVAMPVHAQVVANPASVGMVLVHELFSATGISTDRNRA